jgi:hypothetical protein
MGGTQSAAAHNVDISAGISTVASNDIYGAALAEACTFASVDENGSARTCGTGTTVDAHIATSRARTTKY